MIIQMQTFAREIQQVVRQLPLKHSLRYARAITLSAHHILSSRSLAPADEHMSEVTLQKFGHSYQLKGVPFALIREIYLNEIYFLTPEWRPKPGQIVVDLGANCGAFSLLSAGLGANVIAVEGQPSFVKMFDMLAELNGVKECIDYRLGVLCQGYGSLSFLPRERIASQPQSVGPFSVSEILDEKGISEVALVKIDIEGAEFRLLMEEPGLLRAARRIAMEVHPTFGDPGQLANDLRDIGYLTKLFDKWGREVAMVETPVGFLYAWR